MKNRFTPGEYTFLSELFRRTDPDLFNDLCEICGMDPVDEYLKIMDPYLNEANTGCPPGQGCNTHG